MRRQRIITAKQAKALDKKALEIFGIPTLLLMENAGRGVAEEVSIIVKDKKAKIAVFCGKGNNGGDGLCSARHLITFGIKPEIFLADRFSEVKGEAGINLGILLKLKQKITVINEKNLDSLKKKIAKYSLIVDALLGVGLKGRIRGVYAHLIRLINASGAYVLSVDIPSGLDATGGKILGSCVKADKTVTFVAKKRGMFYGYGPKYCGNIVVKDLGVVL